MSEATILVVEDDPSISKLIVSSLRSRGYEAEPAMCVADAVSYLRDHRPGLILLDLNLPDRPGWDVLEAVVDPMPVVVVSVRKPETDEVERYRPRACLQKPFSIPTLMQAVRTAISG